MNATKEKFTPTFSQSNHSPRQVTSVNELTRGVKYIIHYKDGSSDEIVILYGPYKDGMDEWSIEVWYESLESSEVLLLCNAGVVPYGDGSWNQDIWLEKVEEE